MYVGFHVKCPVILVRYQPKQARAGSILWNSHNIYENPSSGCHALSCGQTYRRTDGNDVATSRFLQLFFECA